jgi:hypothetical protein
MVERMALRLIVISSRNKLYKLSWDEGKRERQRTRKGRINREHRAQSRLGSI